MHHTYCLNEETAERFAMSQLGSPAMDAFEEHLLVCSPCIDRVQGAREYIATVCAATVGRCH